MTAALIKAGTSAARWRRVVQVLLIVLPVLVFSEGLTSQMSHLDDAMYTVNHHEVTTPGWAGLVSVWSPESAWQGRFIEYFPLRDTVYWLVFQVWGADPVPYHLASLLFHIIASLLVFQLLKQAGGSEWVASFGALLFAAHPIHVESVIWISGLKDPMYATCVFASLLAFSRWREHRRPGHYLVSLLFLVAALLVKSMAISTPLLMLAVERFANPRSTRWRDSLLHVAAPAVICAIFLLHFIAVGRANHVPAVPHGGTWTSHVVLSAWVQVLYLKQAFLPSSFHLVNCFAPVERLADPRLLGAILSLAGVAVAIFRWRKLPLRLFAASFYAACLLPVSNLRPIPDLMADRYLYAATVGSCLLVATVFDSGLGRLKNAAAGLLLLTFALVTFWYAAAWKDEESLYAEGDEDPVCMTDPQYPAAQVHVLRYQCAKDDATRFAALERTINSRGILDDHSGLICSVYTEAAQLAQRRGETEKAEKWGKRVIRLCPLVAESWRTAALLTMHRDFAVAATLAERAVRIESTPRARVLQALTQLELKEDEALRGRLIEALHQDPTNSCPELLRWSVGASTDNQGRVMDLLKECAQRGAAP